MRTTIRSIAPLVLVLGFAPAARADYLFRIGPGFYVWNGGMASSVGDGSWVGVGWDSFPGVSPPWDPVAPAPVPVAPAPPPLPTAPVLPPPGFGVPVYPSVPHRAPAAPAAPRAAPPIVVIPSAPPPAGGPTPLAPPVVW